MKDKKKSVRTLISAYDKRFKHDSNEPGIQLYTVVLSVKGYRGYFCPEEERSGAFCFSKSR
uniref:Uncharacterized protein n=1 Tax=Salix viminalis TaxID=40686 RepID=A0A6N2L0Z4_SALVM